MKLTEAIKILKSNTMACWWPSKAMGRNFTDWPRIFDECRHVLKGIMRRQNIPDDCKFFVLDDENPETQLYNEIATAMTVVANTTMQYLPS